MDPVFLASTAVAVLLVAVLAAVVALVAGHRRLEGRLAEARAEVETLGARLDDLARDRGERAGPGPGPTGPSADSGGEPRATPDYLITRLPSPLNARSDHARTDSARLEHRQVEAPVGPVTPLTGREFASVALGESLLRLAALAHGVRRAASAENRNRIGFEMRREVKRSRRQRRRDTRDLLRAGRQSDRAVLAEDAA